MAPVEVYLEIKIQMFFHSNTTADIAIHVVLFALNFLLGLQTSPTPLCKRCALALSDYFLIFAQVPPFSNHRKRECFTGCEKESKLGRFNGLMALTTGV